MNILLLNPDASVHSKRFLRMLLEDGHVVTSAGPQDPRDPDTAGSRYIRFPYGMDTVYRLRRVYRRRLEWWVPVAQLKLIWRLVRPDVVNVHYVDERAWYCVTAGLRPLVLSCWGSDINCFFPPEGRNDRQRQRVASALAAADYVTADSREIIERCEQLAGRRLRTRLVYFGIDTAKFKPGYSQEAQARRRALGISPTAKVVLSSRRLDPFLGQDHILHAFAEAIRDPGTPEAVLVFRRYLANPRVEAELRLEARNLGIEQKVYWLDEAPYHEVPVHYAMADVVVNYPQRDGFPVSLFEALACQRPIISGALPAYDGVLEKDALSLVPPRDRAALARALKACLTDGLDSWRGRFDKGAAIAHAIGDSRKNIRLMNEVFEASAVGARRHSEPGHRA